LPKLATRADGDGRLDDVIARAERIAGRIDQGQDAFALVVMQHRPHERCRSAGDRHQADDHPPGQTGEEDDVEAGGADENRRSQVRLLGDQRERHQQQQAGDDVMAELEHRFVLVEVPGEHQRHGDLQQFGRLDAGKAERQPAPGAIDLDPEEKHQNQQDDADT
jgi:hypothetical protein